MRLACAAFLCLLTAPALASESNWRLGVAVGYGERSNPLIQSDDVPVVVDVDVAWFGKRLFFDNGDLGFTFADRSRFTASAIARVNSDRVFFAKTNTRFVQVSATGAPLASVTLLAPPERSYAIEAGVEVLVDEPWGQITLSGFGDVSGTHGGFEASAAWSHRFHGRRSTLEPHVAVHYKSRALNDYYWGVRAAESNAALPQFGAGGGVNWQVGLRGSYYLSRHLRLAASVDYERLNPAAARSPLVTESGVVGWFAGLAWQF